MEKLRHSDIDSNDAVGDSETDLLVRAIAHAPSRRTPPAVVIGAKWGAAGRYVIDESLGRGGMGSVYAATDSLLGRQVALKIIDDTDDDVAHRARLLREARLAAVVEHERIARVYDVGEHDGALFIAMELVRGETLRAHFDRRRETNAPLDAAHLVDIATQILDGLVALHAKGVVHGDLKPENVIVAESGVKLLDFGSQRRSRRPRDRAWCPSPTRRRRGRATPCSRAHPDTCRPSSATASRSTRGRISSRWALSCSSGSRGSVRSSAGRPAT